MLLANSAYISYIILSYMTFAYIAYEFISYISWKDWRQKKLWAKSVLVHLNLQQQQKQQKQNRTSKTTNKVHKTCSDMKEYVTLFSICRIYADYGSCTTTS